MPRTPLSAGLSDRVRRAFTLIELLVVISIIALLVGILLPALGSARAAAMDTQCKSNMRSGGQAIMMYASEDAQQYLPPGYDVEGRRWNGEHLNRYMSQANNSGGWGEKVNGYLRCPTQEEDCYGTYGVNYGGHGVWISIGIVNSAYRTYADRIDDVIATTYLVGDAHARNYGNSDYNRRRELLNPKLTGSWPWNDDWDADGINDSNAAQLTYGGPYGGWGPWHFGSGNMLFSDGHVAGVAIIDMALNKNGIWGTR